MTKSAILFAILPGIARILTAQTAMIPGVVLTDDQNPVTSATVVYSRIPDLIRETNGHIYAVPSSYASSTVAVDNKGAFQIAGLPAGKYYVCASSSVSNLIRSCDWTTTQAISVSAGAVTANQTLTLRIGSWIYLNVSDPLSRLTGPYTFAAGVITPDGYYARFQLDSQTSTGTVYKVLVPPSTSLALILDTSLTVQDSSGVVPVRKPTRPFAVNGQTTVQLSVTID